MLSKILTPVGITFASVGITLYELFRLRNRINRVFKANINHKISTFENPEIILDQSVSDMQKKMIQLHRNILVLVGYYKGIEQQHNQVNNEINQWQSNAKLALIKGEENLARQALVYKNSLFKKASLLKVSLEELGNQIDYLKQSLSTSESKIHEATTKRELLKVRIRTTQAYKQLENTVEKLIPTSPIASFKQMEEKILPLQSDFKVVKNFNNNLEIRLKQTDFAAENIGMVTEMMQLHLDIANAIAIQKNTYEQYTQVENEVNRYYQQAIEALLKDNKALAREALVYKKIYSQKAYQLKIILEQQKVELDNLRNNVTDFRKSISEAKTKKDIVKAEIKILKTRIEAKLLSANGTTDFSC